MGFLPRRDGFALDLRRAYTTGAPWEHRDAIASSAPVWRPPAPYLEIAGDLRCSGNVIVGTGADDFGLLVVRGDIRCRSLAVSSGFGLFCAGDLRTDEVIVATAGDSLTYVAGRISARLLDSGSGAWLTAYDPAQLRGVPVHGYAMIGGRPQRGEAIDLERVLVAEAVETEEWDALEPEDREGERRSDFIRVDDSAARRILAAGRSILR